MGFCTKFLPGAIFSALVGKYNNTAISLFVTFFYIIFVAMLAFFAQRYFSLLHKDYLPAASILFFLFLTGPFTFGIFIHQFGMLDFYWVFLFGVSFVCILKKHLKWLLPLLIFGMILVHYGAVFCYIPLLLLLILFFSTDSAKKKQYRILFAIILVLALGLTAYFVAFETNNLTYSMEEFNAILNERGAKFVFYYDSSLYRATNELITVNNISDPSFNQNLSFFQKLLSLILYQIEATISNSFPFSRLWFLFVLEIPLVALLLFVLFSYIKWVQDIWKKLLSLSFVFLFFFITLVGFLFSTDTFRWNVHAIICLFISTFTILHFDFRTGYEKVCSLFNRIGYPAIVVFCLFYSLVSVDPYY